MKIFEKIKDFFLTSPDTNYSCSHTQTLETFLKKHANQEINDWFEFENIPFFQTVDEAKQYALTNGGEVVSVKDKTTDETIRTLKELGIKHIERNGFTIICLKGFDGKPILVGDNLYSSINDEDIAGTVSKIEVNITVEYHSSVYTGLRMIDEPKFRYLGETIIELISYPVFPSNGNNSYKRNIDSFDLQRYYRSA